MINILTGFISLLTAFMYVLIYTPMKRITWLNTSIGSIPGALPPVGGWVASTNSIDSGAWILFAILYLWQHPHFFAIAWMYRDDYKRGGFKMLSHYDNTGKRTAMQMFINCGMLYAASLAIFVVNQGSTFYLAGASALILIFFGVIVLFHKERSVENARKVFLASIIYLPLLIGILVLDQFFI